MTRMVSGLAIRLRARKPEAGSRLETLTLLKLTSEYDYDGNEWSGKTERVCANRAPGTEPESNSRNLEFVFRSAGVRNLDAGTHFSGLRVSGDGW